MPGTVSFKKDEWFFETSFPGVRRCKTDAFKIRKVIHRGKTPFQDVFIFESNGFGKMLALDGIIQLSQADEFIYHEMIAHLPLLSHPSPRRMLIVGGGDGGALRECAKHPLQEMVMVEIDRRIVEVAREYLPFISRGVFSDKRVELVFDNGKDFIKRHREYFDLIILDSTDPVGPGKALFELPFYRDVSRALSKDGVAIFQIGPFLDFNLIIRGIARKLGTLFTHVCPVRLPMPSYSCGCEYCFLFASKTHDPRALPLRVLRERLIKRLGTKKAGALKYYTPEIHLASLTMPKLWQI
jgi:spermidine synthase